MKKILAALVLLGATAVALPSLAQTPAPVPNKGDVSWMLVSATLVLMMSIPALALGGIDLSNFRLPLERGGAGLAAISLFAGAADLQSLVETIKAVKL